MVKVDPDSTPLVIVEHRGRAGLEQLEPDWRRLCAATPARSRCHAYEAHRAYLDHLCAEPERVRYLALVETGPGAASGAAGAAANGGATIRAICPLEPVVDPSLRLPLRAWALPSHYHWLATDVIAADSEARQALRPAVRAHLRRHRQGRGLLLLGPMRADLELSGAAAQLPPRSVCLHDTHPSALFDTTVPYAQLMERMSKHFRRNLRSHHNKLQAAGHMELLTFSGAVDQVRPAAELSDRKVHASK